MGGSISRILERRQEPTSRSRGFKLFKKRSDSTTEAVTAIKQNGKKQNSSGTFEDDIVESDLVEINRLEMSDSSSDSSFCSTNSKRLRKYRKSKARKERFFNRRLKQIGFAKARFVQRFRSENQISVEVQEEQSEKVRRWQRSLMPSKIKEPLECMMNTVGITHEQALTLSKMVHDATRDIVLLANFDLIDWDSDKKPFCMVHQTNEHEIMTELGSFRLNPFTKGTRDDDSLAYVETHYRVLEAIFETSTDERNRRMAAYRKKFFRLTLNQAYRIANNLPVKGVPKESGIAAVVRYINRAVTRINMIPVVHCKTPVYGVPFKKYMQDVIDIPEYPIQLLQAMNVYLRKHDLQIIDLRSRSEEVIDRRPYVWDETTVGREVCDMVIRCGPIIEAIRHTAKYFVVYSFFTYLFPYRFYQAIVRYIPGIPLLQKDWVNDGRSRPEIKEKDPFVHKWDNLYYPPNALINRQRREDKRHDDEMIANRLKELKELQKKEAAVMARVGMVREDSPQCSSSSTN